MMPSLGLPLKMLFICSLIVIHQAIWPAKEGEGRATIDYGQDIGFVSGGPDGTNFAMQFTMDYHLSEGLSIGPMVQFVPPGNFTMIGAALVTRYRYKPEFASKLSIVPFLGMGGVHTFLRRGSGPDRFEGHDSSYYVPIGVGLEWELHKSFSLSATFVTNFHDISYGDQFGHDRSSHAAFFGLRYRH